MNQENKRVMIFGVFDRLHAGHLALIAQARKYGDEIIAVVARDSAVKKLKNRLPEQSEDDRLAALAAREEILFAVLGDEKQGVYSPLVMHKPDIICLGYDQDALAEDLEFRMKNGMIPRVQLARLLSLAPDKYHSSLLRTA